MSQLGTDPTFDAVFAIGPCHESLFESFTHKQLRRLQRDVKNSDLKDVIEAYLKRYTIRQADVDAGDHVALLHHYAAIADARLELPPAAYALVVRDWRNAAHLLNGLRPSCPGYGSEGYAEAIAAYRAWEPQWRLGYGPLQLAAGVTLVGQAEGADLTFEGFRYDPGVQGAEDAGFVSVSFPQGVIVHGSLTMENCTATGGEVKEYGGAISGGSITVVRDASLAMEDCRVIGSGSRGVYCNGGKMNATRCTFEDNAHDVPERPLPLRRMHAGVHVLGGEAKLVECVVRNNGGDGLFVDGGGKVTLEGGMISGNKQHGVLAYGSCSKVTVAAAEHSEEVDREQTVSSGNDGHDWATERGSEIEGLAEGIQVNAIVD